MDLAIRTTIRTELNIKPDAEVVDMCEAIRQMMESSKQQGIRQGMQQGIQQDIQQGMQRGSREMQLQIARNMLNANMPMQQVAVLTRLTLLEVQHLQKARN